MAFDSALEERQKVYDETPKEFTEEAAKVIRRKRKPAIEGSWLPNYKTPPFKCLEDFEVQKALQLEDEHYMPCRFRNLYRPATHAVCEDSLDSAIARHPQERLLDCGCAGAADELRWRHIGQDLAAVKHDHAVGVGHFIAQMRSPQYRDRPFSPHGQDQLEQVVAARWIEPDRRFVHEQNAWLVQ
jgi:hypothetical protein